MKSKKAIVKTLIAASLVAGLPLAAQAQQQGADSMAVAGKAPGKVMVAETTRREATVLGVNSGTRNVTLKAKDGRVFIVTAGDQVRNFDQIRVGDKVVTEYTEALTLTLKKGGDGIRERTEKEDMARAPQGEKPAGVAARQVTILANVVAVDTKGQKVTLRGPEGNTVDLKVRDPEQLKMIKKGDQVEAVYTEALAIAVEAAPSAPAAPAKK